MNTGSVFVWGLSGGCLTPRPKTERTPSSPIKPPKAAPPGCSPGMIYFMDLFMVCPCSGQGKRGENLAHKSARNGDPVQPDALTNGEALAPHLAQHVEVALRGARLG